VVIPFTTRLCVAAVAIASFLHLTIAVGHSQVVAPLSEIKTTVFDESGAVIPDSMIVFRSDSTTVDSHTGMDGSVTLRLPRGRYALTTTKAGFVKSMKTDVQIGAPMQDEIRIVLKVDHTPTDGPIFDGVPTTISDLPSVISPEPYPVRSAQPSTKKYRSWQCLYLWKCSTS
jgi:Carboxypeptidase regulatory-like domain